MKKLLLLLLLLAAPRALAATCFIGSYSFTPGSPPSGQITVSAQVACGGSDVTTEAKASFGVSALVSFSTTDASATLGTQIDAGILAALTTKAAAVGITLDATYWRPAGRQGSGLLGCVAGVNLNAANTDTQLNIQASLYKVTELLFTQPSVSLAATPATVAVFTGAGGTGQTVLAATGAVLTPLTNTGANPSYFSATGSSTPALAFVNTRLGSVPSIFIRPAVAHGSAATITVCALGTVLQ